ncbi:tetratricopeptide repeat protein [Nostoc sp. CENA67]|uniref:Tetratricopeptide repeat protein n=1 Tax=Amazonocrinis nigriterrae CENA67 TaxID=2794033 RepID=A0A8J7LBP3_9NOST|nr:tetratricopeptide repeat protein [Amazonocrinis nigriterrae]MBH8565945.1 tetratricopeptide repeat protein [Amazonocrinis nigriterrae CENA67]
MSNSYHYSHSDRFWQYSKFGLMTLGVIFVGMILPQCGSDRNTFNQAEAAYKQADCQTAINLFNNIVDSPSLDETEIARAKAQKAECEAFQTGVDAQNQSNFTTAMESYTKFIESYNNSPLLPVVRQKASNLLQESQPDEIVKASVCERFNLILQNQLLPEPKKNLPYYYQACGQVYTKNAQYNQAIAVYENFLQNYPKHSLVPKIKTALATATLAAAKTDSAGEISPPSPTGRTTTGSTVVFIRNDSPEPMQIVFSGSQPRFEELQACKDCRRYVDTAPKQCPNKGPIGRYVLKPGTYDVVVKSAGGRVRPFTGQWALKDATEYAHCFYIVTGLTLPVSKSTN